MPTTHYTDDQWVDFVNRQLSAEQSRQMQDHLNTGCGRCSSSFEIWDRVRQATAREVEYQVPESAVRHVQNAFAELTFAQSHGRKSDVPRLVFDSFWQPAIAGIRSGSKVPRQVLYRLGDIAMDMRLEPEVNSERMNVTGQISLGKPSESLAGIPVVVSCFAGVLAETTTNQFGEFQLSYIPEKGIRLSFGAIDQKDLTVPLDNTTYGSSVRPV